MAIELIIKIPEEIYKDIMTHNREMRESGKSAYYFEGLIQNGIPLYKGHGRIADMDEAIKCIEDVKGEDAIWAINLIEWACSKRTIIEADKENEK